MEVIKKFKTIDGREFSTEEEGAAWEKKVHEAAGNLVVMKSNYDCLTHRKFTYTEFICELSLCTRIEMVRRAI